MCTLRIIVLPDLLFLSIVVVQGLGLNYIKKQGFWGPASPGYRVIECFISCELVRNVPETALALLKGLWTERHAHRVRSHSSRRSIGLIDRRKLLSSLLPIVSVESFSKGSVEQRGNVSFTDSL